MHNLQSFDGVGTSNWIENLPDAWLLEVKYFSDAGRLTRRSKIMTLLVCGIPNKCADGDASQLPSFADPSSKGRMADKGMHLNHCCSLIPKQRG